MNPTDLEPVTLTGMASLVKADCYSNVVEHETPLEGGRVPMVTLSRTYGTNGTEVGQLLAQRLGVGFYDREILDQVCRQTHADRFLMERLYEKPVNPVEEAIYSLFGKGGNMEMMRVLPGIMAGIQRGGGVILGRGAHLLDAHLPVFRVRLDGSEAVCLRRVMQRLNLPEDEARALIHRKNHERESFTRAVYETFHSPRQFYDMVINTDLYDTGQIVEVILYAMELQHFRLPEAERKEPAATIHPEGRESAWTAADLAQPAG